MSLYTLGIFVLITAFAIGFRIFKGVKTGIIYDEVYTVVNFGQHFRDAVTLYKNPNNNHVLNSILINADRVLFAGHESFYRYHTIFFGVLYCFSVMYLVWTLITSRLLRIAFVALLTLQWFVFDLSFLARGYSIALAAVFGGLALLVWLLKRKIMTSSIWLPIAILTAMNFLAFGSMLSVPLLLVVINGCYILLFSYRVFPEAAKPIRQIGIHLVVVPISSFLPLFLLYRFIYRDILAARDLFGTISSLRQHLLEVLWINMLADSRRWAQGVYILFLTLTAAAIACVIYSLIRTRRFQQVSFLNLKQPQSFIVFTTLLFFAGMYMYRNIFNMSLGYPRNGVFLIPLFLLSCGIILDSACGLPASVRLRAACAGFACVVILMLTAAARPSPYTVKVSTWEIQSLAKPLVGDLRSIDPYRHWKIGLTKQTWHMNLPLQYYQLCGFPVQQANGDDFDVIVIRHSEAAADSFYYRKKFYDNFNCHVLFNPALIQQYSLNEKAGQ
ncbi:MAG: hypothetical protein FJ263_04770 [Planctomycetes bacterium]|nr:hypothetical protein [Planctomycetota bacterium]